MPSGTQIHVDVYDLTEKQHLEIASRRHDLFRLLNFLNEQRLFLASITLF